MMAMVEKKIIMIIRETAFYKSHPNIWTHTHTCVDSEK